ncbi:mucin-7-like [Schistocerca americana]|uniref:mucin-7-like n=1 Tax=Schistocerca americana TaxID=7009 RepID=UPI001F4F2BEA|nr:mucin-7-like [Schistocerca americana]
MRRGKSHRQLVTLEILPVGQHASAATQADRGRGILEGERWVSHSWAIKWQSSGPTRGRGLSESQPLVPTYPSSTTTHPFLRAARPQSRCAAAGLTDTPARSAPAAPRTAAVAAGWVPWDLRRRCLHQRCPTSPMTAGPAPHPREPGPRPGARLARRPVPSILDGGSVLGALNLSPPPEPAPAPPSQPLFALSPCSAKIAPPELADQDAPSLVAPRPPARGRSGRQRSLPSPTSSDTPLSPVHIL